MAELCPRAAERSKTVRCVKKRKLTAEKSWRWPWLLAVSFTEGQVVILDSGTTTTGLARALRNFRNLTIVTERGEYYG